MVPVNVAETALTMLSILAMDEIKDQTQLRKTIDALLKVC